MGAEFAGKRYEMMETLSFIETIRLTEIGQRIIFRKTAEKAKAAQVVPLKKCHDGVWRMLAEAPKFQSGGFRSTSGWEYAINFNLTEEEQKRRYEILHGSWE